MERFIELNIPQSVLSAYKQDRLEAMIKKLGLGKYFSHIIGLDNIYAAGKLHLARNLINIIGNGRLETLMIGDTVHDYEVAREIGSDCVLIAEGHQSKEKLLETGARVYNSLGEFHRSELV
jgi:phosphoglycolate phosphatase